MYIYSIFACIRDMSQVLTWPIESEWLNILVDHVDLYIKPVLCFKWFKISTLPVFVSSGCIKCSLTIIHYILKLHRNLKTTKCNKCQLSSRYLFWNSKFSINRIPYWGYIVLENVWMIFFNWFNKITCWWWILVYLFRNLYRANNQTAMNQRIVHIFHLFHGECLELQKRAF